MTSMLSLQKNSVHLCIYSGDSDFGNHATCQKAVLLETELVGPSCLLVGDSNAVMNSVSLLRY